MTKEELTNLLEEHSLALYDPENRKYWCDGCGALSKFGEPEEHQADILLGVLGEELT